MICPTCGTELHDGAIATEGTQLERVQSVLARGGWYTIAELSRLAAAPEASVSSRIRDLRKPRYGGHVVESRATTDGTVEYTLIPANVPDVDRRARPV